MISVLQRKMRTNIWQQCTERRELFSEVSPAPSRLSELRREAQPLVYVLQKTPVTCDVNTFDERSRR
jgi:hypothetical protein